METEHFQEFLLGHTVNKEEKEEKEERAPKLTEYSSFLFHSSTLVYIGKEVAFP